MKKIILMTSLVVLILAGCVSMPGTPGYVSESISKFDNTREISMVPAQACSSGWEWCLIYLGLYKTSKMPNDKIVMIAEVIGAHNFGEGECLHFNIDGEIFSFSSFDTLTDIKTISGYTRVYNKSSKRFWINMDFLERLINAKKVVVRIDMTKTYAEAEFYGNGGLPTTVRPGFIEFYKRAKTMQQFK